MPSTATTQVGWMQWIERSYSGSCGLTAPGSGNCSQGTSGAFDWVEPHEVRRHGHVIPAGLPSAVAHCLQRCADCSQCRFLTVSVKLQDCSWYHSCDRRALAPFERQFGGSPYLLRSAPTINAALLSREEREVWRLDEYWGDDNSLESGPASYRGSSYPEDMQTRRAWPSIPLNRRRTAGANLSLEESRQHCCGPPLRNVLPKLTHWRCQHGKDCTMANQRQTLLHYLQRKRLGAASCVMAAHQAELDARSIPVGAKQGSSPPLSRARDESAPLPDVGVCITGQARLWAISYVNLHHQLFIPLAGRSDLFWVGAADVSFHAQSLTITQLPGLREIILHQPDPIVRWGNTSRMSVLPSDTEPPHLVFEHPNPVFHTHAKWRSGVHNAQRSMLVQAFHRGVCWQLLVAEEVARGAQYDLVMRLRPDGWFSTPILPPPRGAVQRHAHMLASWVDPIDVYAFGSRASMRVQLEGYAACLVRSVCSAEPYKGGEPLLYSLLLWRFGAAVVESDDGHGWCRRHQWTGGCDGIAHIVRGNIQGRCYFLNAALPDGESGLYYNKGHFFNRETGSQHVFRINDTRLHSAASCLGLEPRRNDSGRDASEVIRKCKNSESYGDFFGRKYRNRTVAAYDPTPWDIDQPWATT